MPANRELPVAPLAAALSGDETSLVDLVDSLLGKGVVVDGEVVLGLAGVDLIYLRLAALLAAADRVQSGSVVAPRSPATAAATPAPGRVREDTLASGSAGPPDLTLTDLPDTERAREPVRVRPASGEALSAAAPGPEAISRWNPDPDDVRKGVMKLVLALAEFIRQLLERQAIRRMEAGTLNEDETERLGTALAQVEETLRELAERAGLDPADLNLDLGPLGKLV
jgi:hypothetical protein